MIVAVTLTSVIRGASGVSAGTGSKGTPALVRKLVNAETRA